MKYAIILVTITLLAVSGCLSPEMRSAKIALNESEYIRALENLDLEIKRMPGNAEVWYLKGYVYEKLSDWVNMAESYTKSLELSEDYKEEIENSNSKLVRRFYLRSVVRFDSSDWTTAIALMDTAIIIDGTNYRLYRQAGITAYKGDMDEQAIKYCLTAIEHEQSIDDAIKASEKGDKNVDPDFNMESRKVILAIYSKNKDYSKVIEWSQNVMARVEETDGNTNDYLSGLDEMITAYEAQENNEAAESAISIAMEKFPDNLQLRLNLATYKTRREDYQGASEILKGVLATHPENVYANVTIGTIYIMDKNFKEAIPYLEAAIAQEPENKSALQNLMSAYYNTDQIDKGSEIRIRWEKLK